VLHPPELILVLNQLRLSVYLQAIRHLTVVGGSIDRHESNNTLITFCWRPREGGWSGRYIQEGDIVLHQEANGNYFRLQGIEFLPNLESLEVECCPSETLRSPAYVDTSMKVGEEYKLGQRTIIVTSHFADSAVVEWNRPMLDIDGTSSCVKTIEIEEPPFKSVSRDLQDLTLNGPFDSRLRHLEVFKMDDIISCDELLELLTVCKSLKTLHIMLFTSDQNGYPEDPEHLLRFLAQTPLEIEDVSLRFCALEWMPYFRRCEKLHIHCDEAFRVDRTGLPRIEWSIQEPPAVKLFTLEILDVLDQAVTAIVDFIRWNTSPKTRIEIQDLTTPREEMPHPERWKDAIKRLIPDSVSSQD
jgi:hypothetical protein